MKKLLPFLPILFLCTIASATLPPITGTTSICGGSTSTLSNATAGGTWSSSNMAVGTIGASSGIVTGVGPGTTTISYTLGADVVTTTVYVMSLAPGTLPGCNNIGVGDTLSYQTFDCLGGSMGMVYSSNPAVASSASSGVIGVAPGSATVYLAGSTGCIVATRNITVTPTRLISKIIGPDMICPGSTSTLTDATPGGVWTSSGPSTATVSSTGIMNGIAPGSSAISYSLPSTSLNCFMNVMVHTQPTPFVGPTSVCTGDSITIGSSYCGYCVDVCYGGVFSSADTTIAKYKVGKFIGVNPGTVTITYTGVQSPYCWRTATLTVNAASVAPIAGTATVCVGAATSLSTTTPGGSWSSGAPGVASIGSSGVVNGIAAGTAIMTYTISNVCGIHSGTTVVTVNALPVAGTITGPDSVCVGAAATLTSSPGGGVWTSSGASATVGASGVVSGVTAGTAIISYAVTNVCGTDVATLSITVNPLPDAGTVTGSDSVCTGDTIMLGSPVSGGVWSSSSTGVATVTTSGVVSGMMTGTAIVGYTVTNGCGIDTAVYPITVDSTYTPVVTLTASPGFFIASGSYDTLVATATGAGPLPTYQWYKNSVAIAGATTNTYISYAFHNGDSVCCRVTGTAPCAQDTWSCSIIHVSQVGIGTLSSTASMTLFPNPNEGAFTIKGSTADDSPVTIEVRNMLGQVLFSEKFTPLNGTVNKQWMVDGALPGGSYVLSVISEEGNSLFHSGFVLRR